MGTSDFRRYRDRVEAGRRLAEALGGYRGADTIVLGIPRGGALVAAEVARALDSELDVIVSCKLTVRDRPEFTIGAVTANGARYLNDEYIRYLQLPADYVDEEMARRIAEARASEEYVRGGEPPVRIGDRIAIVVDDGLVTGVSMRAALRAVREGGPATLIMAVPVGAPESYDAMTGEADQLICPHQPRLFSAVGLHYDHFQTVGEAAVRHALEYGRSEHGQHAASAGSIPRSTLSP